MIRTVGLTAFLACVAAAVVSGESIEKCCPIKINDKPTCYSDLAKAIADAKESDSINIYKDIIIRKEITFKTDLVFSGYGNKKPRIIAKMDTKEGAMLRMVNPKQQVRFHNLEFERFGKGYASALRTTESGDGEHPTEPPFEAAYHIYISSCIFKNFRTLARGGAAVFINQAASLLITNTEFVNNVNENPFDDKKHWQGGGALWIQNMLGSARILNSTFSLNRSQWYHAQGGAVMINYLRGDVDINGVFMHHNSASAGGAMYIGQIRPGYTTTIQNSIFSDNEAKEYGWGTRGGAIWAQNIGGNLLIKKTVVFANNRAPNGRGGAIANNKIYTSGSVVLEATFYNNTCKSEAVIFDSLSSGNGVSISPAIQGNGKLIMTDNVYLAKNVAGRKSKEGNLLVRFSKNDKNATLWYWEKSFIKDKSAGKSVTITKSGVVSKR